MAINFNKSLRILVFAAILYSAFLACQTTDKSDKQNIKTANVKDLAQGPIVHDTLRPDQIEKIKVIQTTFSEVNSSSLEETITDFKRDQHPDNEIQIWLAMATAYEKFISKRTNLDLTKKKEAYGLILMRSMEDEVKAKANSNLKLLTDKEVAEIFSYYDLEAKPVTVNPK